MLVAILLTALARPRGVAVQIAEVRRGDLVVPVQCDGTLEPPPGGELRAAESATVAEILAQEGERVDAGHAARAARERRALAEGPRRALRGAAPERRSARPPRPTSPRPSERRSTGARSSKPTRACSRAARSRAPRPRRTSGRSGRPRTGRAPRAHAARGPRGLGVAPRARRARRRGARASRRRRSRSARRRRASSTACRGASAKPSPPGQVVASVVDPGKPARAGARRPAGPAADRRRAAARPFASTACRASAGRARSPSCRRASSQIEGREVGEVLGEVADPSGKLPTNAAVEVRDRDRREERTRSSCRARASCATATSRYVYRRSRTGGRAAGRSRSDSPGLTEVEIVSGLVREGRRHPAGLDGPLRRPPRPPDRASASASSSS